MTGGQKYGEEVLRYFIDSGWRVTRLSVRSNLRLPLPVRHLFANISCLLLVLPYLKEEVIIIGSTYYHSYILLLGFILKVLRRPILVGLCYHLTVRDVRSSLFRIFDRSISFLSMRLYSRLIAISQSTKNDLLHIGVKEDKISVIPCAHDIPLHDAINYHNDDKRIVFVGTCYGRKGVEYLLKAASKLKRHKFHVDIVGDLKDDEKYVECLYEIVKMENISDRVTFYGRTSNDKLWEIYKNASMFVLPSLWEGFGIVLLEAMSFGLPIIATNVGSIPELITNNVNGILVPPKDETSLAAAMELLLTSDNVRERLGRNALEYLKAHKELSDWKQVGQRAGEVIEKMADKRR